MHPPAYLSKSWALSLATAILVSLDSPCFVFWLKNNNSQASDRWRQRKRHRKFRLVFFLLQLNEVSPVALHKSHIYIMEKHRLNSLLPCDWFYQLVGFDFPVLSPYQGPCFLSSQSWCSLDPYCLPSRLHEHRLWFLNIIFFELETIWTQLIRHRLPSNVACLWSQTITVVHDSLRLIINNFTVIVSFPGSIIFQVERGAPDNKQWLKPYFESAFYASDTYCKAKRKCHNIFPCHSDSFQPLACQHWSGPFPPQCDQVALRK